jgi:predicted permease
MRPLRRAIAGLRALVRRDRVERELDAELREYLESVIDEKMRGGSSRVEATRAARAELGSVEAVKDRVRDAGWEPFVESVWQDVRYGLRRLRHSPGFTAVAIGILTLGIGANTAIFSLVNAIVLRTLPVHAPEELVEPLSHYPDDPHLNGFSWDFYQQLRDRNHVFAAVTGFAPASVKVTRDGAGTETVDGQFVAGNLFDTLGLQPEIGRLIGPHDTAPGAGPVVVISWSYWTTRFGANRAVLGTPIDVNGAPAAIVGVTPRAFTGLLPGVMPDLWLPVTRPMNLALVARMKPGVSGEQARAELNVLNRPRVEAIARQSGNLRWLQATMDLESAAGGLSAFRERFSSPLRILMAVVGLLLVIACTNVASMLLARGAARRREMAVRVSLGAGRMRLARQVLTESLLLSATGAVLGVVLASFGAQALLRFMISGRLPPGWPQHLAIQIGPDIRVLLFTAGLALVTGVLFGLAPAWSAFRAAPISALRETGAAGGHPSRQRFGQGLVVAQVALSVVLLTATGLCVSHVSNLKNRDAGFERSSVLLVTLNPQGSGYNRARLSTLYRELLDRLHAIPGVRSATVCGVAPIDGGAASSFTTVEGYVERPEDRRRVWQNWVGPRYFETLGTPFVAGRDFRFEDAAGPRVAIVNQALARHYFGGASPLGRHLAFERDPVPYEIVGVVGDAKYADLHDPAPQTVYLNTFQDRQIASRFALRTSVEPTSVAPQVRRAVDEILKTVRVEKVRTLEEQVNASIVLERLVAALAGVFGALGTGLAALGLYGLLAYTVARRTNEIGVRMALGATGRDVTRMVLKGALGLVGAGVALGVPAAIWGGHIAASLVQNLQAGRAASIAIAGTIMIGVALLASYLPARRAARINPTEALRHS